MLTMARNIAAQNTFANPFSTLPTGPTAAEPPLYPLILAGLIRLVHLPILVYDVAVVGNILANAAMALLLPIFSIVFYGDVIPGVIASFLWMTTMQSIPGWDTSYTVAGLLLFCRIASSTIVSTKEAKGRAVLLGTIAGLLFLLNPASVFDRASLARISVLADKGQSMWCHAAPHHPGHSLCICNWMVRKKQLSARGIQVCLEVK